MALFAELFRRCRQQQHSTSVRSQLFDRAVLIAGVFRRPLQVMGFVDDQQVPLCPQTLLKMFWIRGEKFDAAQHQLLAEERVVCYRCGRCGRFDSMG